MEFKTEYQNELNKLSPTEEQCERIRSGVMKKLAENKPVKRKKPLYLRIAAVSGAAVCAAAVAIVIFAGNNNRVNMSGNALAPSANDTMGGTMDAVNNAPANGGKDCEFGSNYSEGTKGDGSYIGQASETMPSQGDTTNNGSVGGTPSTAHPAAPKYLEFSENKDYCEVTANNDMIYKYRTAENDGGAFSEENAALAGSNLDTGLFVQFDENIMTVFFADGTLLGVYELIGS